MKAKIREGWFLVRQHMFIAALLFLYQLIWGYFLYRMIQSAVVPLLLRYPDTDAGELSTLLFKMESQLNLSTHPEVHRYLWILGAMLLLRMLISPSFRQDCSTRFSTIIVQKSEFHSSAGLKICGNRCCCSTPFVHYWCFCLATGSCQSCTRF